MNKKRIQQERKEIPGIYEGVQFVLFYKSRRNSKKINRQLLNYKPYSEY